MGDQNAGQTAGSILSAVPIAGVVGEAVNAISTGAANRKSREFQVQMYNRQRQDALADWNMQNAYNSPASQMKRFKDAGLNPNLIYGRGDSGSASTVRSSSPGSFRSQPYQSDIGNIVSNMFQLHANVVAKDAETQKNLSEVALNASRKSEVEAQTENIKSSTRLKDWTFNYNTEIHDFLTNIMADKSKLADVSFQYAGDMDRYKLMIQDKQYANLIQDLSNKATAQAKTEEEKKSIIAARDLLTDRHNLNSFELEMNKAGLTRNDDMVSRLLIKIFDYLRGQ
jgi:hypothetical protein